MAETNPTKTWSLCEILPANHLKPIPFEQFAQPFTGTPDAANMVSLRRIWKSEPEICTEKHELLPAFQHVIDTPEKDHERWLIVAYIRPFTLDNRDLVEFSWRNKGGEVTPTFMEDHSSPWAVETAWQKFYLLGDLPPQIEAWVKRSVRSPEIDGAVRESAYWALGKFYTAHLRKGQVAAFWAEPVLNVMPRSNIA
ncbi:uncharacterized protein BDZ99DRAFT_526248 [Mytilinidion resinicola]|uniref:Uncharacterized protein n=1 Tax=Mytilinidion resinicola TaxID=574789 RepID=A0A6A6Y6E9_9PEZI|nr:uncharacterized protein BDZ99DRAFT_526248 [Mytilinidion resinicola]KAF2803775.1 hypothetical protein BDZ99DRAFT_526248 [Mytilinidion resinicola]